MSGRTILRSTIACLAAAQFLQMCQATLFLPFVFQAEPAPSAERIARVVDSATRLFLQTYRAKPK